MAIQIPMELKFKPEDRDLIDKITSLAVPTFGKCMILSAAMLLNWLGARHNNKSFNDADTAIEATIDAVLAEPDKRTADLGGQLGTQAFAAVVVEALN